MAAIAPDFVMEQVWARAPATVSSNVADVLFSLD